MSSGGRGRSIVNTGRMDAAVDAMMQMGFKPLTIVQTVKDLLRVYGREGWLFIEEHAYAVLLEALLERTSSPEQENADQEVNIPAKEYSEIHGVEMSAAGGSCAIHSPPRSSMQGADTTLQLQNISLQENSMRHDAEASAAGKSSEIHPPPPSSSMQAVDASIQSKNISLQKSSKGSDVGTSPAGKPSVIHSPPPSSGMLAVDSSIQLKKISLKQSSKGNDAGTSTAGEPSLICSAPSPDIDAVDAALEAQQILSHSVPENEPLDSAPHSNEPEERAETSRKRKPCYGWISDGDDDEDFVELTPAYPVVKKKVILIV